MDDTFRNIAFGILAFVVFHGSLETRARHDARRQVVGAFHNTGNIWVHLEPRGPLGLEVSDLYSVDVYGNHVVSDRIPFTVSPKPGWKGSIRHLRLHLSDFTLAGLPIRELSADIPYATYDIGHAIYKGHLVLRGTGTGPAKVRIGEEGLRAFVYKKFGKTLSDVKIAFGNDQRVTLIARSTLLFQSSALLSVTGDLVVRDHRYLDLEHPLMLMNGKPLSALFVASLLKTINPVLDTYRDLNLNDFFTMDHVNITEDVIVISGEVKLPVDTQQTRGN